MYWVLPDGVTVHCQIKAQYPANTLKWLHYDQTKMYEILHLVEPVRGTEVTLFHVLNSHSDNIMCPGIIANSQPSYLNQSHFQHVTKGQLPAAYT